MHKIPLILLIFNGFVSISQIQSPKDSTNLIEEKSLVIKEKKNSSKKTNYQLNPMAASLLSAVLPGTGQVYNRKYWKAPIVWGGAATLYIVYDFYHQKHNFYHQIAIYKDRYNSDEFLTPYISANKSKFTSETTSYIAELEKSIILKRSDNARARKQQFVLFGVLFYIAQVVDATVDAHFDGFDVSEELTLKISPVFFENNPFANGIRLSLIF